MRLLLACTLLAIVAGCSVPAPAPTAPTAGPEAAAPSPPPESPAIRDERARKRLKQESQEMLTKLRDISSEAGDAERYEDRAGVKAQAEAALRLLDRATSLGGQWEELHRRSQLHSDECYAEYVTHVAAALTFLHALLSERKPKYAEDSVRFIQLAQRSWEKADYWERKEIANGRHPSVPEASD